MGIPPECRTRIFQFVLEAEPGLIDFKASTTKARLFEPNEPSLLTNIPHPLLLVSRQVHNEASEHYRVAVHVDHTSDGFARPLDLGRRLPHFLRQSVRTILIKGIDAYKGERIDRTQFPNLKLVEIECMVGTPARQTPGLTFYTSRSFYANCIFASSKHYGDVVSGVHDATIMKETTKRVDLGRMGRTADAEGRGFAIHCIAIVTLFEASRNGARRNERRAGTVSTANRTR